MHKNIPGRFSAANLALVGAFLCATTALAQNYYNAGQQPAYPQGNYRQQPASYAAQPAQMQQPVQYAPNGGYYQQQPVPYPRQGQFRQNMQMQPSATPFPYPKSEYSQDGQLQGPFYFVDESPVQVIKILELLSNKPIMQSPFLPNVKINFTCKDKIFKDEAVEVLKSLLSVNGIAIIPLGENFLKAVPITGINSQSPEFLEGDTSKMEASMVFYTKLYRLEYLETENAQQLFNSFISPNGIATLAFFPRINSFLLTDTLANHQRMEKLLKQIDVKTKIREDMAFIKLKNTSAEEMKKRLSNVNSNILKKYFEKTVIDADERTNQLIIFTQKGNIEYIKKFVEGFDIAAEPLTKSEVFYIKHGEAKDVAKALTDVVKGQQQAAKALKTKASKTRNTNIEKSVASTELKSINGEDAPESAPEKPAQTQQSEASDPTLQFSDFVTIVSNERSNSVIVYGTDSDIKQISTLISKIDVVLLQVKIDVIITEVQLTDEQVSGLSSFNLGYDLASPFKVGTTESLANGFQGGTGTNSLNGTQAFSFKATENSFQAIFNAAKTNSNVKVLSAPTIVTAHNKDGRINVSQSYPIIKSTISSVVNVDNTQSTVEYMDIGINLKVTPFIGDNGLIQLNITQSADTILSQTQISGNSQPVIGKREAESFVSVHDGDIIVLGGLQQNNLSEDGQKVWLLGDIPLLGRLFSPEQHKYQKSELIIFIRPTIINSSSKLGDGQKDHLNGLKSFEMATSYVKDGSFTDKDDSEKAQNFYKTQKQKDEEMRAAKEKAKTETDEKQTEDK